MPIASEAELRATGLSEKVLNTYRLAHATDPPLTEYEGRVKLAKKLGVAHSTVKAHLSRVRLKLEDSALLRKVEGGPPTFDQTHPDGFVDALVELSGPAQNISRVAKEVGLSPSTAQRLAKKLDTDLQPLKRALDDVKLEDLTRRFGTLARDAVDAITPEKLLKAPARDLAIIAGVATDKWQLLRGQPTQRMEIGDRRKMDELLGIILKEAKRRNIEIDVTPEGGVTAKKSPFKNAGHTRQMKAIMSGDPAETLSHP